MFGEKNLVGVDIGSHSIKVVQLKKGRKGKYKLVSFGMAPLPPDTIEENEIISTLNVSSTLQSLFKKLNIKQKEIAMSLSGHSVIIKRITEPMMKDEELHEQIMWEAEQQIPFDINEVEIDYQILQKKVDQGQIEVLLVAAKKEEINTYLQIAYEAGLKPIVLDVDAFALQNVFEYNYSDIYPTIETAKESGIKEFDTVALIDVGASFTTINIVKGGISLYTRDITNGGNTITHEIRRQLNISLEKAETYKIGGSEVVGTEIIPEEVEEIIRSIVEVLAAEVQRSIDFYLATTGEQTISKLFITGGTSHIHSLSQLLEDKLGIEVERLNPFRNIELEPHFTEDFIKRIAPQASISVGLALRTNKEKKR